MEPCATVHPHGGLAGTGHKPGDLSLVVVATPGRGEDGDGVVDGLPQSTEADMPEEMQHSSNKR